MNKCKEGVGKRDSTRVGHPEIPEYRPRNNSGLLQVHHKKQKQKQFNNK